MRKWALLALTATCLLIAVAVLMLRESQFYELPNHYRFVAFSDGQSSLDLARTLNRMPHTRNLGSSRNWLFEASGPVEESRDFLEVWLRKKYGLRQVPSPSFVVFLDDQRSRTIVMFPVKDRQGNIDKSRHRVRINGRWREPGAWEQLLRQFVR